MRLLKFALAVACVLGLAGTANSAEPVKIRMSWVAPVSNWASIVLEKKDLAKHWASPTPLNRCAIRARRR